MAIERAEFLALEGFDERMFLFYEDIDLCLRAVRSGNQVLLHPDWRVIHEVGHATRRDWSIALKASYVSGRYFHAKHRHFVRGYDAYVAADSVARSLLATTVQNDPKRTAYLYLARDALRNFVRSDRRRAV